MSVHRWRRRPTKYFGEVWVPFAQFDLQAQDGRFRSLVLQVDSGAVVSILRRSFADLLGIDLGSGKRVELRGVGGGTTAAYVHTIQTRFAPTLAAAVPYAIAESETVPNLLGRLGVFDVLQIDFDATMQETTIRSPWLDESKGDRRIYDFLLETEKHILARWSKTEHTDLVNGVVACFINRMGQLFATVLAIVKLHRPWTGALFIRAMLETVLEFEYLLGDLDQRSTLYDEFKWITKHRHSQAIANNPAGPVSQALAHSPLRAAGEQRNSREYDRVKQLFLIGGHNGKKTKIAGKWHKMNIADLAKHLNRAGEYRLVFKGCSNWVHGDPLAALHAIRPNGPPSSPWADPNQVFITCVGYYARMLFLLADHGEKIILSDEQYRALERLAKGLS